MTNVPLFELDLDVVHDSHATLAQVRRIYLIKERHMNIYVGNLPFESTEDELQVSFTEYGEVSTARVITDRMTGRSRGFGFVEMPNNDEAEAAIKGMNGKDMGGRQLTVNEARPREDSGSGNSKPRW